MLFTSVFPLFRTQHNHETIHSRERAHVSLARYVIIKSPTPFIPGSITARNFPLRARLPACQPLAPSAEPCCPSLHIPVMWALRNGANRAPVGALAMVKNSPCSRSPPPVYRHRRTRCRPSPSASCAGVSTEWRRARRVRSRLRRRRRLSLPGRRRSTAWC